MDDGYTSSPLIEWKEVVNLFAKLIICGQKPRAALYHEEWYIVNWE